jgi:cyclohexanone monooxygenase
MEQVMSEQELGFDPDQLRERYIQERDKRLRSDASEQYIHIEGDFSYLEADPFIEEVITRDPIKDDTDVILIGGGFGGLCTGARLRMRGVKDIRIIDKAGDMGGTWYFNRYPGINCDIESYVYLPLLEELDYMPEQKYATGHQIFEHCKAIARKYDLYDKALLQTEVTEVFWNEGDERWIIKTNRGDELRARFVSLANGFLQKPKLPGIPGIDKFKGKMFHTCRWDYDYTGGDRTGGDVFRNGPMKMEGLNDKRVGIIGTGATAVQAVPHLGHSAKELYVFQRTPSSVGVRNNSLTDPEWVKSLKPGWHEDRMDNFQTLTAGGYAEEDLVDDGWTEITATLVDIIMSDPTGDLSPEAIDRKAELADFVNMEKVRQRVEEIVDDPATAESLKPYYRQFCKRPCFHDDYLQTFNLPNVKLVDTKGQGVERITENGVVVDGTEYELDCLILSTGFEVGTDYNSRAGFDPVGKDGISLTDYWKDGARTLHGIHLHNFPNFYMMGITQSGFTVNFMSMIEHEARQIAYTIHKCLEEGINVLEVSEEAEEAWTQEVYDRGDKTIDFAMNCTPGYYNGEGKVSPTARQDGFYFGDQPTDYYRLLEEWRDTEELPGMVRK